MDDAERELILRSRQGDGRAFERLVSPYDRRILSLALDMVGNVEDAQDVFQEALLAAYRGLRGFRMESDFSTWLYRIAVNGAIKFRSQRRRRQELPVGTGPVELGQASDSPDQDVLNAELDAQLNLALEQLSGQERAAFTLCHRQGIRIDQAAKLMDCSTGAVKSYLFRGREKVKKNLQHYLEY